MRDFLKGLDLDKETIDTIMAEYGKNVQGLKEQIEEYKGYKTENENLSKQLEEKEKSMKSFEEYRFMHKDRFEDFTSKKGKKMIRDKQTGKTYSEEQYNTGYFTNDGKYMNYSDFNSLLEEKRPKGLSRQIVTIEQI